MNITVKHQVKLDALRRQPERISRFGLVSEEVNKILGKHGFELISAVPAGSLDLNMAYLDVDTQELYDNPKDYPLELQIALKEADSLDILIEDEEVIRTNYRELDMEEEYKYQTFGWAEELLNIWGLASRAANISLKQIRVAIQSVSNVPNAAHIQAIKDVDRCPRLENIPIRTIEEFMTACEELDEEQIEVVNVVVNKPVPRSKLNIPISYAINPGKYVNMKLRGE